jgi:hypothetical protein
MESTNTNHRSENLSIPQSKDTKTNGLNNFSDAIDDALQNKKTPHEQNRENYKIDVKEAIPQPQIAWGLLNANTNDFEIIGTLSNFSLIIGKAKAKKSFLVSMAVATALTKDILHGQLKSGLPREQNEVVYFDTEQGKYHVQKAVKRICKQINIEEPTNLHAFHLRSLNPAERLEFIESEIYSNDKIGFVVIDGIKDLIKSINDEAEATMITSKLLKWTEERNIHIVNVLHQNKGDNNARGHLGTELINKAETVISVTVIENDKEVSIVEPLQCRNREPDSFAFSIDENGIPFILNGYELPIKKITNSFSVTELEDFKKYKLLMEVFSHEKEYKYGALVSQLKIACKNQLKKDLGDNRLKVLLADCKNNGWLIQLIAKGSYTLGEFKNESDIDEDINLSV